MTDRYLNVSSLERQIEKVLERIERPLPQDSDYYMALMENKRLLIEEYEKTTGKFYIRKGYVGL